MERVPPPGNFSVLLRDLLHLIMKNLSPGDALKLRQTCSWFNHFVSVHCNQYWFFMSFSFVVHELPLPKRFDFLHHTTYFPLCDDSSCDESNCQKFFVPYVHCWGPNAAHIIMGDFDEFDEYQDEFEKTFKDYSVANFKRDTLKQVFCTMRKLNDVLGPIDGSCITSHPDHWDFLPDLDPRHHPQTLLEMAYDPKQNYFVTFFHGQIRKSNVEFENWEQTLTIQEARVKRTYEDTISDLQNRIDKAR